MHSPARGWLALDPKGVYGESTYDAANAILNPSGVDALIESEERIRKTAAVLARKLGVNPARLLRFTFAHACLSASWHIGDKEDPRHALRMAAIIEPLLGAGL
jgi:streptomycin 6-kinase